MRMLTEETHAYPRNRGMCVQEQINHGEHLIILSYNYKAEGPAQPAYSSKDRGHEFY